MAIYEFQREWFQDGENKKFKAWKVDQTGVYHALHGSGLEDPEVFRRVVMCMQYCLNNEVIE